MIGVDEVGRGAWAGPLVVVAARLKDGAEHIKGLADSKTLSYVKREYYADIIPSRYDIGFGWVYSGELDRLGLAKALREGARRAVQAIASSENDPILIDGTVNLLSETSYTDVQTMKKADAIIPEVSAASIIAKVTRDKYMYNLAKNYPEYDFDNNVGYGTKKHTDAIVNYGLTAVHRSSFTLPKGLSA